VLDAVCGPQIRLEPQRHAHRVALSHSFGFGGNNCALLFGRTDPSR
jgi:3-oxoacyl-[acyl-carrier-protein] synthase-1